MLRNLLAFVYLSAVILTVSGLPLHEDEQEVSSGAIEGSHVHAYAETSAEPLPDPAKSEDDPESSNNGPSEGTNTDDKGPAVHIETTNPLPSSPSGEQSNQDNKLLIPTLLLPPLITFSVTPPTYVAPPAPPSPAGVVVMPQRPGAVPYGYSSNNVVVGSNNHDVIMVVPPPNQNTPYSSNLIFINPASTPC